MDLTQNSPVLKRFPARRLWTLIPALAAAALCFGMRNSFPVRAVSSAAEPTCERGAEDYLRQTARILGSRFNEAFYRAAVEKQARRLADRNPRSDAVPRECFTSLAAEDDPGVSEALGFLDEFAAAEAELSIDGFSAGKNPVDSLVERAAPLSVPPSRPTQTFMPRPAEIPLSVEFIFLFSLVSFLASILIPAPPFAAAVGMGITAVEEWCRRLVRSLSALYGSRVLRLRKRAEKPRSLCRAPFEEKLCIVLLL